MTVPTDIKHIVRDPGIYGGKPCIEGHRIAVHDVAAVHNRGSSPEQIASEHFPTLTVAQVYAALLYYAEHKEEIDHELADDAADIKARAAADSSPLAQRVRAAISERKRRIPLQGA